MGETAREHREQRECYQWNTDNKPQNHDPVGLSQKAFEKNIHSLHFWSVSHIKIEKPFHKYCWLTTPVGDMLLLSFYIRDNWSSDIFIPGKWAPLHVHHEQIGTRNNHAVSLHLYFYLIYIYRLAILTTLIYTSL